MRKIILSSFSAFVILNQSLLAQEASSLENGNVAIVQSPEGYRYVSISKTDVNRLFCENGEFTEFTFSSEKEMDIQKSGKNAFLKLTPINEMQGDVVLNTSVSDFTREAYLTCDNKMFSLVFVPKDVSAQTIVLKTPTEHKSKNENKVQIVNEYQSVVSDLIKNAYKEQMPEEYEFKLIDKVEKEFNELTLIKFKQYSGDLFDVTEYLIRANQQIEINEKIFLPFMKKPLAIAIDSLSLKKDATTRMFVVSNVLENADSIQSSGRYSNTINILNNINKTNPEKNEHVKVDQEIIDFINNK